MYDRGTNIDYLAYEGIWTDWSNGPVLGLTLTLNRHTGNLLIAFTASFIAFVAARFWRILSVACHRCYSTSSGRASLHHQRQTILRNSASPDAAVWSLLELFFAWRHVMPRRRLLGLILPLLSLALLVWAAFTLAGGFSSSLASGVQNTVLLKRQDCGFTDISVKGSGPDLAERSVAVNTASNYAQRCYGQNTTLVTRCNQYVEPKLTHYVNHDASCPFDPSMCRSQSKNIRLDTGIVNLKTLGFNTPPDAEMGMKQVLHCAPLVTKGYGKTFATSDGDVVRYHYGKFKAPHRDMPYLYQVQTVEDQYRPRLQEGSFGKAPAMYHLDVRVSHMVDGKWLEEPYTFVPLDNMRRTDGDLTVALLSGAGVLFQKPWHDDWYRVTTKSPKGVWDESAEKTLPVYQPKEAASPLGCVEQFQYCNLAIRGDEEAQCGPLSSFSDAINGAAPKFNFHSFINITDLHQLSLEGRDPSRFFWLVMMKMTNPMSIHDVIGALGSKALASQTALFGGVQYSIEGDGQPRWHSDVENWFNIMLAGWQGIFASHPLGPMTNGIEGFRVPPRNDNERELCEMQKVQTTQFISFSVLGLCFIYALGGLIILASALVGPVLKYLYNRNGYQAYQQVEWTMNSCLHLQRLAHELVGYGQWSNCADDVPITVGEAPLAALNIEDRDHPTLTKPSWTGMYGIHKTEDDDGDEDDDANEKEAEATPGVVVAVRRSQSHLLEDLDTT